MVPVDRRVAAAFLFGRTTALADGVADEDAAGVDDDDAVGDADRLRVVVGRPLPRLKMATGASDIAR